MAQLHTKVIQAKTLKSPLAQVIGLFISLTLSWSDYQSFTNGLISLVVHTGPRLDFNSPVVGVKLINLDLKLQLNRCIIIL